MKQAISLILFLTLVLSISGCNNSANVSPTSAPEKSTTPSETAPSENRPTTPPATEEPPAQSCTHDFEVTARKESTCSEEGYIDYTCKLCGICEAATLEPIGHILLDATCIAPKICRVCGETQGTALGHKYVNDQCIRCGHTQISSSPECNHSFQVASQTLPTCTQEGSVTYSCSNCGDSYCQSIPAAGHSLADATCLTPPTCRICSAASGNALGHTYGDNSLCIRCGAKDPYKPADSPPSQGTEPQTSSFTLTVRSKNTPIPNITVTVYVDNSATPAGSGITNAKGKVVLTLTAGNSYKVILSNVPAGYEYKESYTFSSTTVNINLNLVPVLDPNDHSNGLYQTGSTMADFTLTDTDGNTYTLSELLETKKTVILNFWYVDCTPCKNEFPHFEELYKQYGDDIQLLALSHMDSEAEIRQLKSDMGLTFPMIYENIGMRQGFNLAFYPTTVVIGRGMEILEIHQGSYTYQEAQALFEKYSK